MRIALLDDSEPIWFPKPELASTEGLLAVGGSLTRDRLLLAYSNGIFPWELRGNPPLWHWYSPDPRFVLFPEEFKVSRSIKKALKNKRCVVRVDTAFREVMEACAEVKRRNQPGTWIAPEMIDAYCFLHDEGLAHSFETFVGEELVGGLYGISLGRSFFGESMFHHQAEASKVALASLVHFAKSQHFRFIDCQSPTAHLHRLGARSIPRTSFLEILAESMQAGSAPGKWKL